MQSQQYIRTSGGFAPDEESTLPTSPTHSIVTVAAPNDSPHSACHNMKAGDLSGDSRQADHPTSKYCSMSMMEDECGSYALTSPASVKSSVSTRHATAATQEGEQVSGCSNDGIRSPDLWNALSSILDVDDSDCESDSVLSGRSDASTRFECNHHTQVVEWDRMEDLMRTHEYGAWMARSQEEDGCAS